MKPNKITMKIALMQVEDCNLNAKQSHVPAQKMLVTFQNTVWNRKESSQKKQATKQVRRYKKERGEEDTIRELTWKRSEMW